MRYLADRPNPLRRGFFSSLGIEAGRVVSTELHHTRRLRFIDGAGLEDPADESEAAGELDAGLLEGQDMGDGGPDAIEGRDGIVLGPAAASGRFAAAVTVADCMPIWILDRRSGAYGVLHSGWKGTGILSNAVHGLSTRYATPPSEISVILGPAIGSCCYEVPAERALAYEREFGAAAVDRSGPRPRIDIRAANLALALTLGVGSLLSADACTSCEAPLGSYRREGASAFTRMVALCLPS
jgi:hypothetical protein